MKTKCINCLASIVILCAIISCGSKNDGEMDPILTVAPSVTVKPDESDNPVKPTEPTKSNSIAGTWTMYSNKYGITTKASKDGSFSLSYHDGEAMDIDAKVTFKENPNTFSGTGSYVIEIKKEVDGESSKEKVKVSNFFTNGTWEMSKAGTITIKNEGGNVIDISITYLDSKELELFVVEEEVSEKEGAKVETTIEMKMAFIRNE